MTRRPSNILSSAQVRAIQKRKAAESAPVVMVSFDAIFNMVVREAEKRGRQWYGRGVDALTLVREVEALAPDTRKEARLLVLDRLDRFPLKHSGVIPHS